MVYAFKASPMRMFNKNHYVSPKCSECKYFSKGNCKLFKYSFASVIEKENNMEDYVPVLDARANQNLCGIDGLYFKPK